ncbi:hydrogen peroxide-dependent heme synthase [Microbacterium sp.]|uniref:hydrogen peroxide-dependent heme synthase n=1 Tax=Microbacterium sp. TaxID=51671 RepID=UPI002E367953|nr:hydrogen peroxide-dependent heme synthase [Microbacterium sp.]HEX5728575.1 hydrogen peroxide-dependent heme synthase [Microbacterium sp.]
MTNDTQARVGYALWAVFACPAGFRPAGTDTSTLSIAIDALAESGVSLRGIYDVSGLRADADVMLWLTGDDAQRLQAALRSLRRAAPLAELTPRWNALGVHRDAEFTRDHAPSFMRGLPPKSWVTVYPFVRSLDWYILPEDERRGMLGEHGRMGRDYPQVQPNTVAAFALGDYEWILALEADDPIDLVDLMRHLRATEARRHVREEIPFFTGRLIGLDELEDVLA